LVLDHLVNEENIHIETVKAEIERKKAVQSEEERL
jgi:hypothetical protein